MSEVKRLTPDRVRMRWWVESKWTTNLGCINLATTSFWRHYQRHSLCVCLSDKVGRRNILEFAWCCQKYLPLSFTQLFFVSICACFFPQKFVFLLVTSTHNFPFIHFSRLSTTLAPLLSHQLFSSKWRARESNLISVHWDREKTHKQSCFENKPSNHQVRQSTICCLAHF